MSKPKQIKPIDGFANVTDGDLVSRATSIQRGMNGKHQFPESAGGSDGLKTANVILSRTLAPNS